MATGTTAGGRVREVEIPINGVTLRGDLVVPRTASGIVLFAHGAGSSRFSPRNQAVAAALQDRSIGTLLFDLLTEEEERAEATTRHYRFDVNMLADRLAVATTWVHAQPELRHLAIGYFGASTGAAAALIAATRLPSLVRAVVSRGGRPDLADAALPSVSAATLLIVGGNDGIVVDLNRQAHQRLTAVKAFDVIPGATHLFEEPGALEEVAHLASDWFSHHLAPPHREPRDMYAW